MDVLDRSLVDEVLRLRSAQLFAPADDVRRVASIIAERGWRRTGVRVYAWDDGAFVVSLVDSKADRFMLEVFPSRLAATYARDGNGRGPRLIDVLDELRGLRKAG